MIVGVDEEMIPAHLMPERRWLLGVRDLHFASRTKYVSLPPGIFYASVDKREYSAQFMWSNLIDLENISHSCFSIYCYYCQLGMAANTPPACEPVVFIQP
jgi:hypothetical protein